MRVPVKHPCRKHTIIVDANGTILFSDQTDNYRVRPEPETFFQALAD